MIIPMRHQKLSLNEKNILDALNKQHLTSIQILNRIESISLILHVYTLLDDLSSKGYITSYVKKDVKYHYASQFFTDKLILNKSIINIFN